MALADELQRAKAREEIAKLDAGERRIAAQLGIDPTKPNSELSDALRPELAAYQTWCAKNSCRYLPTKPYVLAQFLRDTAQLGVPWGKLAKFVAAVRAQHDRFHLADPTNSQIVLQTIEQIAPAVEAPRSWPAADKAAFAGLPQPVQEIIARHEAERSKALRQAQNRLADERKRLSSGADKPAQTNEKDYQHVSTSQV
jgi:hypothetical protein